MSIRTPRIPRRTRTVTTMNALSIDLPPTRRTGLPTRPDGSEEPSSLCKLPTVVIVDGPGQSQSDETILDIARQAGDLRGADLAGRMPISPAAEHPLVDGARSKLIVRDRGHDLAGVDRPRRGVAPLEDIPVDVEQPPRVGFEESYGPEVIVGVLGEPGVLAQDRLIVAEESAGHGTRPASVLPLGLGRQPVPGAGEEIVGEPHVRADRFGVALLALRQALLLREPATVPDRVVPGHPTDRGPRVAAHVPGLHEVRLETAKLLDRHFVGGDGEAAVDEAGVAGLQMIAPRLRFGRAHLENHRPAEDHQGLTLPVDVPVPQGRPPLQLFLKLAQFRGPIPLPQEPLRARMDPRIRVVLVEPAALGEDGGPLRLRQAFLGEAAQRLQDGLP